ncbi:MAG: hypothetical protein H6Q83_873 [Deltaproteobacteria bacterium]|nr:hypothetical protein [Deltaproteobacteria bacterium]
MRRTAGLALILAGAFLLVVSLVGDRTDAGRYVNLPPRSWERFDPVLASRTPDLESLYRAAQGRAGRNLREMQPQEAMDHLYGAVSDRFTHGDRAKYNLFSNWILWAAGTVSPRRRYMQDPDALLRNGHSAMCGETSYILLRLAGMAGIPSRHVHMNGHIVMEARFSDRWHAYDPDFEVLVRDGSGKILSVAEAAAQPGLLQRAYAGRGPSTQTESVLTIYTNTGDDMYVSYPPKSFFSPVGHWPGRVEQAAKLARYPVPAALMAAGALLARPGRPRKGRPRR